MTWGLFSSKSSWGSYSYSTKNCYSYKDYGKKDYGHKDYGHKDSGKKGWDDKDYGKGGRNDCDDKGRDDKDWGDKDWGHKDWGYKCDYDWSYSKCDWDWGYKCDFSWGDKCDWGGKFDWKWKCDWDWKDKCDPKPPCDPKDENDPPEPAPDEACVCADDDVTINVLANDSDLNNDALTIAAIVTDFGADGMLGGGDDTVENIAEGGSVILASGATVTLDGGELVYDPTTSTEFSDLLIGEEGEDAFGYVVSDGEDTATAQVDVDICGALNTIETISASLPDTLGFSITAGPEANPGAGDAFTVTLSSSDPNFDGLVIENAYCLSEFDGILTGTPLEGDVYIADLAHIPADALTQTGFGGVEAREHLDLVNWILNQDFTSVDNGEGSNYTDAEIQGAIWGLTDGFTFVFPGEGTNANANEIRDLALANGEGFEAGEGDIVGLFLDPTDPTIDAGHSQPFIVGIPFDDLSQDCICNCA